MDPCAVIRDMTKWDNNPISHTGFAEAAVRAYKIAMTPPMGPVAVVVDEHRHVESIPANTSIPRYTKPTAPQGDAH
jgi:acetolactate synthase I/II/III large subunit